MRQKRFNKSRFCDKNVELITLAFEEAQKAHLATQEQRNAAFAKFQFFIRKGVYFENTRGLSQAILKLSEQVVAEIGTENTTISEAKELITDAIAALHSSDIFTRQEFSKAICDQASDISESNYFYFGPCEVFRFECEEKQLESKFVSVVPTKNLPQQFNTDFISITPNLPLKLERIDGQTVASFGEFSWRIETRSSKSGAPERARWMAEVFLSAIRLGLKVPDYCHRPKIGELEAIPTTTWNRSSLSLVENEGAWSGFGVTSVPQYKVDTQFWEDFHSESFQTRISSIFEADRSKLAGRLSDGMIWLTRGRQSSDPSQRLLMFFTALEALFSDQNSFSPVADSISRYVAVVLSDQSEDRANTYNEVRKLYSLRSELVHRGRRNAHSLNANNIQYICEACFSIVLNETSLMCDHKEFLNSLKSATFGGSWNAGKT